MPLQLFLEIVGLYRQEIASLKEQLALALADDIADAEAVETAKREAEDAKARAISAEQILEEYKNTDTAEDQQLIDAMNAVLVELKSSEPVEA
jgi:hypothetical protein